MGLAAFLRKYYEIPYAGNLLMILLSLLYLVYSTTQMTSYAAMSLGLCKLSGLSSMKAVFFFNPSSLAGEASIERVFGEIIPNLS